MKYESIPQLIDALGGPTAVALSLFGTKKSQPTVSKMKERGTIPVRYWIGLRAHAKSRGIKLTNDQIVQAHGVERIEA